MLISHETPGCQAEQAHCMPSSFPGQCLSCVTPIPCPGAEFLHARAGQCPHTHRREALPLWLGGVWHMGSTAFTEGKEMVCKTAGEMDRDGKFPFPSKCQCTSTTSCAYKIFCLLETNPRSYRQSKLLRETEGCLLRLIRMGNGWAAGWTGKNKLPDILPSAVQTPSIFLFSPLGFAKPKGFRCLTFRT